MHCFSAFEPSIHKLHVIYPVNSVALCLFWQIVILLDEQSRISFIMELLQDKNQQQLPHQSCHCEICRYRPKITLRPELSDIKTPNSMHKLITLLPPTFPILIEHTLLIEYKQPQILQYHLHANYLKDQKCKWLINHQLVRSIHAITTQNVALYYQYRQKIMPKFQAAALLSNPSSSIHSQQLLYIQPYQPRPIVRIYFSNQKRPLKDQLLIEHLRKQQERYKSNTYKPNEEFFEWVYTEYGENTFCNFITQLYIKLFKVATNHSITTGIFYWVLEPIKSDIQNSKSGARAQYEQMQLMGRPRKLTFKPKLVNVRQLQIQYYEKLYSFQEEYSELIKKRIYSSSKKHISAIKNKAYRSRLQNFREKLQNVYHKEQQAVLSKVEPQKAFEFEQDSEKMARLLVPNLPKNQTLREVLSDEKAFRMLISKPRHKRLLTQTAKPNPNTLGSVHLQKEKRLMRNSTLKPDIRHMQSVHKRYLNLLRTPSTQDKND